MSLIEWLDGKATDILAIYSVMAKEIRIPHVK